MASIAGTDVTSASETAPVTGSDRMSRTTMVDACGRGDRPRRRPVRHQRAVRLSHRDHRMFRGDRRVQPASDHPHRARLAVPLRLRRRRCLCVGVRRGERSGFHSSAGLSPARSRRPLLALLIGPIILRLTGKYFVLITFLLGEILRMVFIDWQSVTGGANGFFDIPAPAPVVRQPEVVLPARARGGGVLHRGLRPHPVVRDRTLRQRDPRIRARWPNASACRSSAPRS